MRRASDVARAPSTTRIVIRRLLGGVILAVVAFAGVDRLVIAVHGSDLTAMAAGGASALVTGGLMLWRAVAPVIASQADLQVRYEAALADALRDPLTGLGNHRAFHEELDRQVSAALRYEVPLTLLLLDLDEFKAINDGRGHAAGDRVLRAFGELLTVAIRRADRAFRIGGDEFAVLLPHTDLAGSHVVARRLLTQALEPTLRIADAEPISFSGGMSSLPELGLGPAELFTQADAALYAAKRAGRTEVMSFSPTMEVHEGSSGASASAVIELIGKGQLTAVYQPIIALTDGRVIGVEGLIRPLSPSPFATPAQLFTAAEVAGQGTRLDLTCIDTIVAGAAQRLPMDQFLTVNLSPTTLVSSEFSTGALLAILSRYEFAPERLIVELTEHHPLRELDVARARMAACRRAGIQFAADDIGAGNAGLKLLSDVQFEVLKVDLSLVQRGEGGPSGAVLGSVVDLAMRTGALVVAEGIEHSSQLEPLLRLGITAGQGFYLGRPGPIEQAMEPVRPMIAASPDGLAGVAAWRQSIGLPVS